MAEFWRALRTLKALQLDQAAAPMDGVAPCPEIARRLTPNEPERRPERRSEPRLEYALIPDRPEPGSALHESPSTRQPNEPGPGRDRQQAPVSCLPQEAAPRPRSNEPNSQRKP